MTKFLIEKEIFTCSKTAILKIDSNYCDLEVRTGWELRLIERLFSAFTYTITTQNYMNFDCEKKGNVVIVCDGNERNFIISMLMKINDKTKFDSIYFVDIYQDVKCIEEEINSISPDYVFIVDYYSVEEELISFIQRKGIFLFFCLFLPQYDTIDTTISEINKQMLFLKISKFKDKIVFNIDNNGIMFGNYYFKRDTNVICFYPGYTPNIEIIDDVFYNLLTKQVWNKEKLSMETISFPKFKNEIERFLLNTSFYDCFHSIGGVDRCIQLALENGIIRKCYDKEIISRYNTKQAVHNHSFKNTQFVYEYVFNISE